VIFLDALPTTATGKVRRVELRASAVGLLGEPGDGEADRTNGADQADEAGRMDGVDGTGGAAR
jgi:hypothetical protein